MAVLTRFDPPANVNDFETSEVALAESFRNEWSRRVQNWFRVGMVGDPWDADNDAPRSRFFSPLGLDAASLIHPDAHLWTAFPKRILDGFEPTHTRQDILKFADEGPPFDPIDPTNSYLPQGPRGWQDEYCEWAATRNAAGKITKVVFTCENPEYWETLWFLSPEKVRDLYRKYQGENTIQVSDLSQKDDDGNDILDPETGRPAYDRTNIWNRNTAAGGKNGVMHLISPPNNLFAEIYLAAAATILRKKSTHEVTDRDELIACGRYGSPGRNSDPSIGFYVNDLVRANNIAATLANPVGLYIAGLAVNGFVLPNTAPTGTNPLDFWKVVRGTNNMILRAEYSVPAAMGFTVGDIMIGTENITRGAQLAERIQVKLAGAGRPAAGAATSLGCVQTRSVPQRLPRIVTFFVNGGAKEDFVRGQTHQGIGIYCTNSPASSTIEITGGDVTVTVTNRETQQRQDPETGELVLDVFLTANLQITAAAAPGLRDAAVKVGATLHPASAGVIDILETPSSGPAPLSLNAPSAAHADTAAAAVSQLHHRDLQKHATRSFVPQGKPKR